MKQHEAVVQALKASGGVATLGDIYRRALAIPDCTWGTKTPYATIRRILQTRPELFFKIRPGLWGLKEYEDQILKQLRLDTTATPEQHQQFDHSYFQGLLVEIGNLKRYQTFVPRQDQNKSFLNHRLGNLVSLQALPPFTYPRLVEKASTIDVVWMNERGFPEAFFEVEHTTNFVSALVKFGEFIDFRVSLHIVADDARQRQFEDTISQRQFDAIRPHLKFWSYSKVAKYHSHLSELAQVGLDF